MRGNIVELAIAVIMGLAFAAVVKSLTDNILMPIITAIVGKPSFGDLTFTIHKSVFRYGAFLNDLITFVLTAAAVFFFIVKPLQILAARRARGEEPPAKPSAEGQLLTEIRDALQPR